MAIGERIRFIRNLRGMTQKYLGMAIGFTEKTADVRMAQYESGARTPKENMTADLANVLGVCPQALAIPDIDSDIGLMHTLFALEDLRGLKVSEIDGELCLRLDKSRGMTYVGMLEMLSAWHEQAAKLEAGEITKEEYDKWRYNYPKFDTSQRWAKVPSQEMSDCFVDKLKKVARNESFSSTIQYMEKEVRSVNIKYTGNDTKKSEKGKVHVKNGNYTGCGARIDDNPQDWVTTSEKVTCDKNGCKN